MLFLVQWLTSAAWAWGIYAAEPRWAGTRRSACRVLALLGWRVTLGAASGGFSTGGQEYFPQPWEKSLDSKLVQRPGIWILSVVTTVRWEDSVFILRISSQDCEQALKVSTPPNSGERNSGPNWIFLLPAMHRELRLSGPTFSQDSPCYRRQQWLHGPDHFSMWVKTGRKSILARNVVYLIPSKPLPVVTPEQLQ